MNGHPTASLNKCLKYISLTSARDASDLAGHMPTEEKPQAVNEKLLQFLRAL
jgi:pimeloyl-ACP methyl ester carboxylesterase